MENLKQFYKGKKVLVTGHTGFKGSWLSLWLNYLGAEVVGYALDPQNVKGIFLLCELRNFLKDKRGDIKDKAHLNRVFQEYKPDIVFHLAAQPLVSESYLDPINTFETNLNGTLNVLEEIKLSSEKIVGVFITTDKVYLNKENPSGYVESDSLGGFDPYSASKAACEIAISAWQSSFIRSSGGSSVASARAGNVIGGGDWSKNRLIPDIYKSIENNSDLDVRNLKAIRPWQHVLDPLFGYLVLAMNCWFKPNDFSQAWNFGPDITQVKTVLDVIKEIEKITEKKIKSTQLKENFHETEILLLNSNKSKSRLGWQNKINFEDTIKLTNEWYQNSKQISYYDLAINQIKFYMEKQ